MSEGTLNSINLRERLFFYIVFAILIILMLLMIQPFFTVLVVSLISVIMLKPVYDYIFGLNWVKERKGLAASLTLIVVLVILVIPVVLIIWLTLNQLSGLLEQLAALDLDAFIQSILQSVAELPLVGEVQPVETSATDSVQPLIRAAAQVVTDLIVSLGSSLPSLIIQAVIFVVVVAALLPVYDTLIPRLEEISPLGPELSKLYTGKTTAMVKSLVLGVFLIAIVQGAAMGFFFWLAGLPYVFLLTLLSMLLAMIPMVGISWLVIALAIISFLTGNWVQGVILLGGFYGVVNWIDILLRPKLLSEEASISFALFIVAIFGGLVWAGIMGLFYGPVLMLLLVTTIQIYAERYAHEDRNLLGEALSRLGNASEASAPEACEAGMEAGAEGRDRVDSEGRA
ncbi:MAG: AI-2E family transporter [Anaerolineae bacterium]|jgi:predicted PurR-regulated permease PerM